MDMLEALNTNKQNWTVNIAKNPKNANGHHVIDDKNEQSAGIDENKNYGSDENTSVYRIFVGNLSFQSTDKTLDDVFGGFGKFERIWITDKTSGKFYGSAMLDFFEKQAATTALRMNGKLVLDRQLKVNMAQGDAKYSKNRYNTKPQPGPRVKSLVVQALSERIPNLRTIFIGNCSHDITDDHIHELFGQCGTIKEIRWVERDNIFTGAGFVEFEEESAIDKAVELGGTVILGRKLRVDYAPSN